MQYVFKLKEYFPNILFYTIGNQQYIKILAENVWHFLYFIKNHTNTLFQQLIDLSLVDYPERKFRFEIIYNLLSIKYNTRLIITSATTEGSYFDSITNIYFGAN
jgi:NADH:ubiquinone oxidoreductase subunit C